jgi:hypothetical protein
LTGTGAEGAKYAFAVFEGKIVEMYEINKWHRAGRTEYITGRTFSEKELATRFEFTGRVAPENVREKYVGRTLSEPHSQNPIKYFKC